MKILSRCVIAALVALLIGGPRWLYETSLIFSVRDAQGGIWLAYSTIICAGTVFSAFVFGVLSMSFFAKKMPVWGAVPLLGLVLLGGCTAYYMVILVQIRGALADAQNPSTSPERLRALVGYQTGFGYEIDNRIASNPNTPIDVLRSLHGKPHQVGTETSLARNPNTPDDILMELAKRDDYWKDLMQKALDSNPRYAEIVGSTTKSDSRDSQ